MVLAQSTSAREQNAMFNVYPHLPIDPVAAEGVFIKTSDGRRILDMYGGHAVAALGYGHATLTGAIQRQAETMLFQSNAVAVDIRATAAEKLGAFAGAGLERVFFCNSGAEANENALRIACKTTARKKIVALKHGFHGRTAAAGAVTWGNQNWYGFPATPFEVVFAPRDDAAACAALIDESTAAIILEPVQGVAGAFDLQTAFIRDVAKKARSAGALLIADEVQSGIGRSGHPFAIERAGVVPDIVTCAKSLGGGVPCAALLAGNDIAGEFGFGSLGTTFGGSPLAAAAVVAVIETIEQRELLNNVRERERQIREHCIVGPVSAVQGAGLLLGLRCDDGAARVRDGLLERNILCGTSADPSILRLLPPLVIEAEHIELLANALSGM